MLRGMVGKFRGERAEISGMVQKIESIKVVEGEAL